MNHTKNAFSLSDSITLMVIICLLIGGIYTGQAVIENACLKNALNTILFLQNQFELFTQNSGRYPGTLYLETDPTNNAPSTTDQLLEGNFDSLNPTDKSRIAWAQLRKAGLLSADKNVSDETIQLSNPFGGIYGFQNTPFDGAISSVALCLNNVPRYAAQAIDSALDDGIGTRGKVQATAETTSPGGANHVPTDYNRAAKFVVCIQL